MARRDEWDEWKEAKEDIKRLFKDLPSLKTELKQYETERQAIMESLPSSGVNPRVQSGDVSDPVYEKTVKLQKLTERHLKTFLLLKRMESVDTILNNEEKRLFRLYFKEGRSMTAISKILGRTQGTIKRRLDLLTEKLYFWLV